MRKFLWMLAIFPVFESGACKCPQTDISHHIDEVFDVIVGKVVAEQEEVLECNPTYITNSFRYHLKVDYAYKKNLSGTVEIYGGKGWGDCGAILYPGYHYQIAVFKCEKGYYTSMCADNNYLPNAGLTLWYLNNYFNVNYHPVAIEFVISTTLISLALLISLSLLATYNFYQYRSQRFSLRSVQAKLRYAAISTRCQSTFKFGSMLAKMRGH